MRRVFACSLAISASLSLALRTMGRFLTIWPDISRMGRITSDVVRGVGVTQFIGVGGIDRIELIVLESYILYRIQTLSA